MTQTQREPVPRVDTGELDTAMAFLGFARHCVLKKADGLSEAELRRPMVQSGTSLLWLLVHLAEVEHYWFVHTLAGEPAVDRDEDLGGPAADAIRRYREAIEESDRRIRAVGDPSAKLALTVDGRDLSLRWLLAHMTTETTRHAGHADIIRELLDGTTGR